LTGNAATFDVGEDVVLASCFDDAEGRERSVALGGLREVLSTGLAVDGYFAGTRVQAHPCYRTLATTGCLNEERHLRLLDLGSGVFERELGWLLGGVRMLGTCVDLELGCHLATQAIVRQHAGDRLAHGLGWLLVQEITVGTGLETARVARVAVDHLVGELVARQHDLVSVDNDDVIASICVRSEDGLVLAPQDAGNFSRHATEDEALGIDDEPFTFDVARFWGESLHGCFSVSAARSQWGQPHRLRAVSGDCTPTNRVRRAFCHSEVTRTHASSDSPTLRFSRILRNFGRWGTKCDLRTVRAI